MEEMTKIVINGKVFFGEKEETILEVAKKNGIEIPNLCHDSRLSPFGSCGLCVVEQVGVPKLLRACATKISQNMEILTESVRVSEARTVNLALYLSDHDGDCCAPCQKSCPAGTDCQGYVDLIAQGKFSEANARVKERVPLPASLGRVCPRPCEDNCRRSLRDESISIRALKRFASEEDSNQKNQYIPEISPETGKKVAIIGSGPYGLSTAFFLRERGHAVTIFEAQPLAGGMLRYGIPEYRLPKTVLQREIDLIVAMGVELRCGQRVSNVSFEEIRLAFDAVCVGIGAWKSTGIGCEGEHHPGVLEGISFLGEVSSGNPPNFLQKRVIVVGGGNTAMDACRTAVRLGAAEVSVVYRRERQDMPAELTEISEALEEGVVLRTLRSPKRFFQEDSGRLSIDLQIMEPSGLDAFGRRSVVELPGETETILADFVILAVGQRVETGTFCQIPRTKRGGLICDSAGKTSLPGVFAGGDCCNDKISVAVEAIADAQRTARAVHEFLSGEPLPETGNNRENAFGLPEPPYMHARKEVSPEEYEERERRCRAEEPCLAPEIRRKNFTEVAKTLAERTAKEEAARCLACGCAGFEACKLLKYSREYKADPEPYIIEEHPPLRCQNLAKKQEYSGKYPQYDPGKCILCGLCVRICEEIIGISALGFVGRGFGVSVQPALGGTFAESGCNGCGECALACPTGALVLPI